MSKNTKQPNNIPVLHRKKATETENPTIESIVPTPTPEKKVVVYTAETEASSLLDLSELENAFTDFSMDDILSTSVATQKHYNVGEQLQGTICGGTTEFYLVNIGGKSEAMLANQGQGYTIGTNISATVLSITHGTITLVEKIHKTNDITAYQIALDNGLPIQGTVESVNKGGFVVKFGTFMGFCPISQISIGKAEDSKHIGQVYDFLITKIQENELVVSRKKLLDKQRADQKDAVLSSIQIGSDITGTVQRVTEFGAFIDLGGVDGLLHKNLITQLGIEVDTGDKITVRVESIKDGKISLSAPQHDPWAKVGSVYLLGGQYTVKLLKQKEFGFIGVLEGNLQGVFHNSQFQHSNVAYKVDQEVLLEITEVDFDKKKIRFGLPNAPSKRQNTVANTSSGSSFGDIFTKFAEHNAQKKNRK